MGCCSTKTYAPAGKDETTTRPDNFYEGAVPSESNPDCQQETFEAVLRSAWWSQSEEDNSDINHARLIYDNPGRLDQFYTLDEKKLGSGSFGSVRRAIKKDTGSTRAIKSIRKLKEQDSRFTKREIQIMKMMDHPNILKLFETFEDERKIHLVVELCHGGDLLQRYIDTGPFTEVQVALLMQQMFRAVYFLHSHHVVHRDIKPENFLFWTQDPIEENTLKLIDFGLSTRCVPGQTLATKAGTPCYSSPQVLAGRYNQACDLWSCGVTMYFLLCGQQCFGGKTDAEVMRSIRVGNYAFNGPGWKNVSELTKDLVRNLLKYQPEERIDAGQALRHEYLEKAPRVPRDVLFRPALVAKFRSFCSQNRLKRAALHIVAQQLDEEDTRLLRNTFTALDTMDDGVLCAQELEQGFAKALDSAFENDGRISAAEVEENLDDIQRLLVEIGDANSAIGYTEFLAATIEAEHYQQDRACWVAFCVFDRNGDGLISRQELEQTLGCSRQPVTTTASLDKAMQSVDENCDGFIDFDEFKRMMKTCEPRGGAGRTQIEARSRGPRIEDF